MSSRTTAKPKKPFRERLNEQYGEGLVSREWVGNCYAVVNRYKVVENLGEWETSTGDRLWLDIMEDRDGTRFLRIMQINLSGVKSHIKVELSDLKAFIEGLEDAQIEWAMVSDHPMPVRLISDHHVRLHDRMGRKGERERCPAHLGETCNNKFHHCFVCGEVVGMCHKEDHLEY